MNESGLSELWIGCDLLGSNAAQHIMTGKGYAHVCHQDPQTCPNGSLATTPPTALYVTGWG